MNTFITQHAIDRYRERFSENLGDRAIKNIIYNAFKRSVLHKNKTAERNIEARKIKRGNMILLVQEAPSGDIIYIKSVYKINAKI